MPNRRLCVFFHFRLMWLLAASMSVSAVTPALSQEVTYGDLPKLESEFQTAYDNKDYGKALEFAEKMNEVLEPKHVGNLYNIARLHCLKGDKKKAYEWLDRAVEAGYWDVQTLIDDEDFSSIRKEDRFRTLARYAWSNGYIAMLEREERADFQKPQRVMTTLAFKPGERVADVGAGSGYFTVPVAKAVGPEGIVWAIDIQQPMLDYIEKRLQVEKLDNVKLKLVQRDDPQLPPGGVDTILMIDTLHYVKDRVAYAKKLRAGLAPGGRLVIIDYRPKPWEERPWGPPPEQQIPKETIDADMAAAGLKPVRVHDFLPEQYFVEYGVQ